jgi:UDP-N-acetylmuramoylalanine--D-glutamate ligase
MSDSVPLAAAPLVAATFAPDVFAGQRFAVVGLGRNGLPAARALGAMGADVVAWDDSVAARAQATAEGIMVAKPTMLGLTALVLSPGIAHRLPQPHPLAERAIAAGVPIVSDADLLFRAVRASGSRARFAGITGTNGKSTTTALLAHILAVAGLTVAAGGNLGTAALALPLLPDDGVYVLEMSSYMLERLGNLRFDVAAMLNLSADHLDRHGDMAGYAYAKRAIFDRQVAGNIAVFGVDDAPSRDMFDSFAGHMAALRSISADRHADMSAAGGKLHDSHGVICDLAAARALPGAHNAQNAAAAAAMTLALGVGRAAIAAGIVSYPGLPHRQEHVGTIAGVSFVNDSKATNADSTARALACYPRVVWIAGGLAKAGGIVPLAPFFPRIAAAFLIGRDAPDLAATLAEHGVPHEQVGTLDAAVAEAARAAFGGAAPVVLLSPACASWDQFTGFDARGDRFRDLVRDLRGAR